MSWRSRANQSSKQFRPAALLPPARRPNPPAPIASPWPDTAENSPTPQAPVTTDGFRDAKNLELLRKNNRQGDIRRKKAAGAVSTKGHHYRLMLCAEVVVHVPPQTNIYQRDRPAWSRQAPIPSPNRPPRHVVPKAVQHLTACAPEREWPAACPRCP